MNGTTDKRPDILVVNSLVEPHGWEFVAAPVLGDGVRGWFVPQRRKLALRRIKPPWRGLDLDALVLDDFNLVSSGESGRVVVLSGIYLPEQIQRRGIGGVLLRRLTPIWRAAGALEVHASVGTAAGDAALRAWGFEDAPELLPGLPRRYLEIAY